MYVCIYIYVHISFGIYMIVYLRAIYKVRPPSF